MSYKFQFYTKITKEKRFIYESCYPADYKYYITKHHIYLFIWKLIKDQIHVHKTFLPHKVTHPVIIVSTLICRYHTVPCSARLPRYIIHCIARARGHSDHMGQVQFFLHHEVQYARCKHSSGGASLQDKSRFFYIHNRRPLFLQIVSSQCQIPESIRIYWHYLIII